MAFSVGLSSVSNKRLARVIGSLTVTPKKDQYGEKGDICCFQIDRASDTLKVPIGRWAELGFTKFPLTEKDFPKARFKHRRKLFTIETDLEKHYRDQDQVFKEALHQLKDHNTCFLGCPTGFGKCFDPATEIRMFDRSVKQVRDVKPGDVILGARLEPKMIHTITTGSDEMFRVWYLTPKGRVLAFTANRPHILCLATALPARGGGLDPLETLVNISIDEYLKLDEATRSKLKGYCRQAVPEERDEKYSQSIREMWEDAGAKGKQIKYDLLTPNELDDWLNGWSRICSTGDVQAGTTEIARHICGRLGYLMTDDLQIDRSGSYQIEVEPIGIGAYAGFTLGCEDRRFLLANGVVAHNTTIGCELAASLGLKTLVMCFMQKVRDQWVEAFETHTTAKVQHVKGKKPLDPDADVYIIGTDKISRMDPKQFAKIGTVIFDEAHQSIVKAFTSSLFNIEPLYLIGMSASPNRADGLGKLLEVAFGPKKNFIIRKEQKTFTVIKVETDIVPTVTYRFGGPRGQTLDWTKLISSLAASEDRHYLVAKRIADYLKDKPDERMLVMAKRKNEATSIANFLKDMAKRSKRLVGTADKSKAVILIIGAKKFPKDAPEYRIQIVGMKKGGVGYDDPTRTCSALVSDVIDPNQYEGRVRKAGGVLLDFVDCNKTLEAHWRKREKWYTGRGATILVEPRSRLLSGADSRSVVSTRLVPIRTKPR